MLIFTRLRRQALLLDRYCAALRRDRAATPPDELDPALAQVAAQVESGLRLPEPSARFGEQLWQRCAAASDAPTTESRDRAWHGPAVDPTRQRRTRRETTESEEQRVMSDLSDTRTPPTPSSLEQRRWLREGLKIAAAVLIFAVIGVVVVMTLPRDDNDQRPIVPAESTPIPASPSPVSSPTVDATATRQAARDSLTATAGAQPTAPPTVLASSLPPAGTVAARIPVGTEPQGLAFAAGAIWVPNSRDGTVSRIDPATNQIVATITIGEPGGGYGSPTTVAARGDEIWVGDNEALKLVRIDPATNQIVATIDLTTAPHGIAVGDHALWLSYQSTLVRLDPDTGETVATIFLDGTGAYGVAATDSAIWVQSRILVYRVDPATNTIVASISIPGANNLLGLAADEDSVWTGDWFTYLIYRIDPATNQAVATIPWVIEHPGHYVITDDSVWVASNNHLPTYGLMRIDLATNDVIGVMSIDICEGIAAGAGSVWVSTVDQDPGPVLRIDPAP